MAGPFYVDIGSPGSWQGRDGTNSASPWLGISGLQKAFDTVDNGEICYVKGTGDLSKFYTVTYDASSGTTLTDGEEVTWDTGEGAWGDGSDKGIVRVSVSTASGSGTVELELTTGTMPADNDVIKGTTSTQTITRATTANANKSIDVDTKAGTNAVGFIKFIGTNSSWAIDGTRAIVDANDSQVHIITFTGTADLYWLQNLEVYDNAGATKNGFNWSTSSSEGFVLINCAASLCTGSGFYPANNCQIGSFICCVSYSNQYGFYGAGSGNRYLFCAAYGNSSCGFFNIGGQNEALIGCISHDNTDDDINLNYNAALVMNCVVDGGDNDGIGVTASTNIRHHLIIGNRITNHTQAGTDSGIDCNSEMVVYGWNYFEDNGDASADHIINDTIAQIINVDASGYPGRGTTDSNEYDGTDTNEGYVSKVGDDFSTNYTDGADPTLRRKAITIPWT